MKFLPIVMLPFLIFTNIAMAAEKNFLVAQDQFYSQVSGNGLESGFVFDITVLARKDETGELLYTTPALEFRNDSAECSLEGHSNIKFWDKEFFYRGRGGHDIYRVTLRASVLTRVAADSGRCLVIVNASENSQRVLKIVDYDYNIHR